jgi:hypothetical protein
MATGSTTVIGTIGFEVRVSEGRSHCRYISTAEIPSALPIFQPHHQLIGHEAV